MLWIAVISLGLLIGPTAAQEAQEEQAQEEQAQEEQAQEEQAQEEQAQQEQLQAPYGVWMPEDEGSKVEIYPCGDAMCGRVTWMLEEFDENGNILTDIYNPNPALRSAPVLGLVIMTDIKPTEDEGVWRGRVYNPQDGRTYDFWLTVKSETQITIQGCGLYNLVCQTHTWDRVDS